MIRYRFPTSKGSLLSAVIASVLATSPVVRADEVPNEHDEVTAKRPMNALAEVVVLAQRTTLEIARAAQQQAPNLVNLMTADEISKLPDVNTGEAIRRVPGISLETDTGEGRYVNIRGLDADLNSTTFGGLRLPPTNNSSPSGAARAVAFDSIPIGFVGAITVTKSNLPEQDAEALGGTIDITPKTAPASGKAFADLKLGTGFEVLRHSWITDASLTTGTRFGGTDGYQPFSVLLTAAVYTDRRGIDDVEAGFVDAQPGVPDKAYASFEQRYYNYHRERHGYGIDLGYEPDASNQWYVRYYDAGYSETVIRNRLIWNFSGSPTIDPSNANGFLDTATFKKTLRDEKEFLDSKVIMAGGKNDLQGAVLDYHVGYTKGTYYKPYDYNSSFENNGITSTAYDNTSLPNWPTVAVITGTNPADPTGYVLAGLRNQVQHADDHEWGIGVNLAIPTRFTDAANENFKFGVNARLREKTGSRESFSVNGLPALPLTQAITGDNIHFYQGHYQNGPQINGDVLRALYASTTVTIDSDFIDNALNDQRDKENVYALYGQYQFGFGPLGMIAGVRVERTQATYAGNKFDAFTNLITPVSNDKSYTDFFPTLQARYEINPDLIARASVSSTIARPGFNQVTATTIIDPAGNIVTGNPQLKPTTATGIDFAIEKYLPHAGIASLGVFDKEIDDYIVTQATQTTSRTTGGLPGLVSLLSFSNAPKACLYGIEANYVQKFREQLPGLLSGLGVSVNWTWVSSSYEIRPGEKSVLPSSSRNTANAALLYDLNSVHLTLGGYYVSRNIFGVGASAATDQWSQERVSVDFGSQWQLTNPMTIYLNLKNLTNTPLKLTEGPSQNRVLQQEFYGITAQAGLTYKF